MKKFFTLLLVVAVAWTGWQAYLYNKSPLRPFVPFIVLPANVSVGDTIGVIEPHLISIRNLDPVIIGPDSANIVHYEEQWTEKAARGQEVVSYGDARLLPRDWNGSLEGSNYQEDGGLWWRESGSQTRVTVLSKLGRRALVKVVTPTPILRRYCDWVRNGGPPCPQGAIFFLEGNYLDRMVAAENRFRTMESKHRQALANERRRNEQAVQRRAQEVAERDSQAVADRAVVANILKK